MCAERGSRTPTEYNLQRFLRPSCLPFHHLGKVYNLKLMCSYYILDDMTIQEIYDLAIEMGMKADPRGYAKVKKILTKRKEEYKELSEKKKKYFDEETLTNPYSDSRILAGDSKKNVKKVLAGIDANGTEVLLVDRLNQKGEGIDLLIGHHPEGNAFANLHEVMD